MNISTENRPGKKLRAEANSIDTFGTDETPRDFVLQALFHENS